MSKNGEYEDKIGMGAVQTDKGSRFFRCLDYFIRLNWCVNFGRSFSCNSTWLFMR